MIVFRQRSTTAMGTAFGPFGFAMPSYGSIVEVVAGALTGTLTLAASLTGTLTLRPSLTGSLQVEPD